MAVRDAGLASGTRPLDVHLAEYSAADNDEAMALDRLCAQGGAYRLSFRRATFHRRAENFPEWRIRTARLGDTLVGTLGVAIKDAVLRGKETRAAFLFDLRVHPAHRRRGIARRLGEDAVRWAFERAPFAYIYVVADNRVTQHLAGILGGTPAGGYRYLVYPTYRSGRSAGGVDAVDHATARDALLRHAPPFDFSCPASFRPGEGGYRGSWLVHWGRHAAGCSAWSNRGILGEVVERLPAGLRLARRVLGSRPFTSRPWPHIPDPGEELRSWYLFDFFATDGEVARGLLRGVEEEARRHDVDYCYVIHQAGEPWVPALRSDLPRLFAPTIPYRLLARAADGEVPRLERIHVDIRDL